jgi:hypothetical protein
MRLAAILLLIATPALAQGLIGPPLPEGIPPEIAPREWMPKIPSEADKIWALKRAYELNGNLMVGPTVDLTEEYKERQRSHVIQPVYKPNFPLADPKRKNPLDATSDMTNPDLAPNPCKRHGLRKKESADGKSWKCRK